MLTLSYLEDQKLLALGTWIMAKPDTHLGLRLHLLKPSIP